MTIKAGYPPPSLVFQDAPVYTTDQTVTTTPRDFWPVSPATKTITGPGIYLVDLFCEASHGTVNGNGQWTLETSPDTVTWAIADISPSANWGFKFSIANNLVPLSKLLRYVKTTFALEYLRIRMVTGAGTMTVHGSASYVVNGVRVFKHPTW